MKRITTWIALGWSVICVGCAAEVSDPDVDDSPVGVSEEPLRQGHHPRHEHCGRDADSRSAEAIVDQSFVPPPLDLGASLNDGFRFAAQTFTAAVDGSLTAVSVDILNDSTLPPHIGIRAVSNGLPEAVNLAEGTATGGSTLADRIALSAPVRQRAGQQFAIVVDYPDASPPGHGTWAGATGDLYGDGTFAASADGSSWQVGSGADVFFETFVVPRKHPHCR